MTCKCAYKRRKGENLGNGEGEAAEVRMCTDGKGGFFPFKHHHHPHHPCQFCPPGTRRSAGG